MHILLFQRQFNIEISTHMNVDRTVTVHVGSCIFSDDFTLIFSHLPTSVLPSQNLKTDPRKVESAEE